MTQPLDPLVKAERTIERLSLDNGRLRSMNKKLIRRGGGVAIDEAIDEFKAVLEQEKSRPFILKPTVFPKVGLNKNRLPIKEGHSETPVLLLSDWHLSERVRSKDSNGINEYGSIICSNRVWDVVNTSKQVITLHRALYDIPEIRVMILGDMINGTIHEELTLTNDLTDPAATILCARLIQMALEELKTLGIKIKVECVVGNHPRLTAKMPTKRIAHLSNDWVVYEMVKNYFHKDDQIEIVVHTSQMGMPEIMGHRFVIEHGISVKNNAEDSFEDAIRALFDDPIYRNATGLSGTTFDCIIIGNMHKPKWLERVIVNGCLTGQNELGMSWRLKPIKAQQFLFGVSEKHVRTWQYPIDVTNIRSEKASNTMSEYTKWFMKENGK